MSQTIENKIISEQVEVEKANRRSSCRSKEVLVMRMYQDMSFKEISESTGVSINTALGRMRYALMNLRKL
jgi:RNA polymerase sigma-70 factor (ECF subfamily)